MLYTAVRNNVVLTVKTGNRENAEILGRGLFTEFELNGECRNTRTVANKHGDLVLSLRSVDPLKTVLDMATLLKRVGVDEFDLAFRHKLTEEWSIFHGAESTAKPRLSGTESGFVVTTRKERRIRLFSKSTLSL